MRRAAFTAASAVALSLAGSGTALGDAQTKPQYQVQCGDMSFLVVSPDHAAAGQDLGSTSVLVVPAGSVPQAQLMTCTATNLANGDTFTGSFLVAPANH
jgi:hypothetical protein